MVKSILVCLDGSKNSLKALDYAIHLARQMKAKLTLAEVVEEYGPLPGYYGVPPVSEDQAEWIANQRLESLLPALSELDIPFHRIIRQGFPAEEILKIQEEGDFDMIVVGTRGNNAVTRFLIGSVSDKIIHHSKCPVLVVR